MKAAVTIAAALVVTAFAVSEATAHTIDGHGTGHQDASYCASCSMGTISDAQPCSASTGREWGAVGGAYEVIVHYLPATRHMARTLANDDDPEPFPLPVPGVGILAADDDDDPEPFPIPVPGIGKFADHGGLSAVGGVQRVSSSINQDWTMSDSAIDGMPQPGAGWWCVVEIVGTPRLASLGEHGLYAMPSDDAFLHELAKRGLKAPPAGAGWMEVDAAAMLRLYEEWLKKQQRKQ